MVGPSRKMGGASPEPQLISIRVSYPSRIWLTRDPISFLGGPKLFRDSREDTGCRGHWSWIEIGHGEKLVANMSSTAR